MERHASDTEKLRLGHVYNQAAADKVSTFIEKYLVLESGRKFELLPWMREFINSVYGWIKPNGTRSTKIGLLTCGRKNAKSCLSYGLTAYHLIADGEQSPSCVSCAVNKEQAAQIFEGFRFSIECNPYLSKALHAVPSKKVIQYPAKNGRYRSLASDTQGGNFGHGHTFVLHDEQAFHKRDDLYIQLKNSTDARPNGLQIITSTAGWNKNGQFYKLVEYGRKILSGEIIDTAFQPWIYEAANEDFDDPANWRLANPSLGVVQSEDDFRANWDRDKQEPTSRLSAVRLKMNRWTDAEDGWINVEDWDACSQAVKIPEGAAVTLGVDIGAVRDLTAVSAVALIDGKYVAESWGFVPAGALQTRDAVNTHIYQTCQADGSLTVTPGQATDERLLCAFLDKLCSKYKVMSVAIDKWQSIVISNHLMAKGIETFNFYQSHSMYNGPCLELEKLVSQKRIVVANNTLLRWQVAHTFLSRDSKGYVKPTTSRYENKKDNLCSLLMGLSQTLVQSQAAAGRISIYETRPLFTV